jgi:hypothetical protein
MMIVSVALLSACETWVEEEEAATADGTGDTYRRLCNYFHNNNREMK